MISGRHRFRLQLRRLAALLGAAAVLFAQVATTAYACSVPPQAATAMAPMAMDMTNADMPCQEAVQGPTNLCLQHCQYGQQTAGEVQFPPVTPPALAYRLRAPADDLLLAKPVRDHSSFLLVRTTAPPLPVRNCCFRI